MPDNNQAPDPTSTPSQSYTDVPEQTSTSSELQHSFTGASDQPLSNPSLQSPVQDVVANPTDTQQSIPTDSQQNDSFSDQPQAVVTAPHAPKKYGGKKVIATIFGILLLVGGVAAGVILVQRQQQIAEKAASGKECQQSQDCVLLDNPGNSGSFTAPRPISYVKITAKDVHEYESGDTNDGCYHVVINGSFLSWNRVGEGPDCKDVSNVQVWMKEGEATPTSTPTPEPTEVPEETPTPTSKVTPTETPDTPTEVTAQCSDVKAYDEEWILLSSQDLSNLKKGDTVRFTVSGSTSSGTFDKARFTVNGTSLGETTKKKPGSNEFYVEYIVPAGVTTFTVKGEVHHSQLKWI